MAEWQLSLGNLPLCAYTLLITIYSLMLRTPRYLTAENAEIAEIICQNLGALRVCARGGKSA